MSKKVRKSIGLVIAAFLSICLFISPIYETKSLAADPYTALSKATRKYNGHDYSAEYNPLYYYLNYQDLREAFGTDGNKLIEHYVIFGKKEKRVANRLIGDSTEFVVPTGKENMVIIPKTLHGNGGMTADQEVQARSIAKQIADGINKTATDKVKEIEKVAYAAGIVRAYCDLGTYTTTGQMYRTAYGVFIGGEYSCAGSTRALGLILDYLGITWVHVNANTWDDQWCQVIADGQEGYGDAIKAVAAYGKHPNQGGDEKAGISYSKIRSKFDVATQKPRQTD